MQYYHVHSPPKRAKRATLVSIGNDENPTLRYKSWRPSGDSARYLVKRQMNHPWQKHSTLRFQYNAGSTTRLAHPRRLGRESGLPVSCRQEGFGGALIHKMRKGLSWLMALALDSAWTRSRFQLSILWNF